MTNEEIKMIIEKHEKWLIDENSGEHRGEIINDAANSVAESYDDYMEIWNYLQCNF